MFENIGFDLTLETFRQLNVNLSRSGRREKNKTVYTYTTVKN